MKARICKYDDGVYHQRTYETKVINFHLEFDNIEKEVDEHKLIVMLNRILKEHKLLKDSYVGICLDSVKVTPYVFNDQLNINYKDTEEVKND
jgi:hypothetical protein